MSWSTNSQLEGVEEKNINSHLSALYSIVELATNSKMSHEDLMNVALMQKNTFFKEQPVSQLFKCSNGSISEDDYNSILESFKLKVYPKYNPSLPTLFCEEYIYSLSHIVLKSLRLFRLGKVRGVLNCMKQKNPKFFVDCVIKD